MVCLDNFKFGKFLEMIRLVVKLVCKKFRDFGEVGGFLGFLFWFLLGSVIFSFFIYGRGCDLVGCRFFC